MRPHGVWIAYPGMGASSSPAQLGTNCVLAVPLQSSGPSPPAARRWVSWSARACGGQRSGRRRSAPLSCGGWPSRVEPSGLASIALVTRQLMRSNCAAVGRRWHARSFVIAREIADHQGEGYGRKRQGNPKRAQMAQPFPYRFGHFRWDDDPGADRCSSPLSRPLVRRGRRQPAGLVRPPRPWRLFGRPAHAAGLGSAARCGPAPRRRSLPAVRSSRL